jgi:hypothetical protein
MSYMDGRFDDFNQVWAVIRQRESDTGIGIGFDGQNQLVRARQYLGETPDAVLESLPPAAGRPMQASRAELLVACGRVPEAVAILQETFVGVEEDADESAYSVLTAVLNIAVAIGDTELTRALRRRLTPLGTRLDMGVTTCTSRVLGHASAMLGEAGVARAQYGSALEFSQSLRFRPEIALTHLDLAELLLEHYPDERDAAIEHLDFAIAELRDMKMQPALERALRHRGLLKA